MYEKNRAEKALAERDRVNKDSGLMHAVRKSEQGQIEEEDIHVLFQRKRNVALLIYQQIETAALIRNFVGLFVNENDRYTDLEKEYCNFIKIYDPMFKTILLESQRALGLEASQ